MNSTPDAQTKVAIPTTTALELETLPPERGTPQDLETMLARTDALIKAGYQFPEGRGASSYYSRDLMGVPFIITSEPRYATQPAREVNINGKSTMLKASPVAQVAIRFVDLATMTYSEPVLATFSDNYLQNQIRAFTQQELFAAVWTVAYNEKHSIPSGHPRMLTPFDRRTVVVEEAEWGRPSPAQVADMEALRTQIAKRGKGSGAVASVATTAESIANELEAQGLFPWEDGDQDEEAEEDEYEPTPKRRGRPRGSGGSTPRTLQTRGN